jgi:hypothetical protein
MSDAQFKEIYGEEAIRTAAGRVDGRVEKE